MIIDFFKWSDPELSLHKLKEKDNIIVKDQANDLGEHHHVINRRIWLSFGEVLHHLEESDSDFLHSLLNSISDRQIEILN
jgi:hypothetical protein